MGLRELSVARTVSDVGTLAAARKAVALTATRLVPMDGRTGSLLDSTDSDDDDWVDGSKMP